MLKKRASLSVSKKEEVPAITAEASKDEETKRASLGSKIRLSFSFKGKPKEAAAAGIDLEKEKSSSKATTEEPHPYENIDSLPDRRRAPSRKSVTWKDPKTDDLNEILRTRAKSVKDRDGRRTSLTWTQSPMNGEKS